MLYVLFEGYMCFLRIRRDLYTIVHTRTWRVQEVVMCEICMSIFYVNNNQVSKYVN